MRVADRASAGASRIDGELLRWTSGEDVGRNTAEHDCGLMVLLSIMRMWYRASRYGREVFLDRNGWCIIAALLAFTMLCRTAALVFCWEEMSRPDLFLQPVPENWVFSLTLITHVFAVLAWLRARTAWQRSLPAVCLVCAFLCYAEGTHRSTAGRPCSSLHDYHCATERYGMSGAGAFGDKLVGTLAIGAVALLIFGRNVHAQTLRSVLLKPMRTTGRMVDRDARR